MPCAGVPNEGEEEVLVIVIRISAKVRALGRALRKPGFIPEITERAAASGAAAGDPAFTPPGQARRNPGFIPEITERAAASWAAARHRPLPSPATAFALSRRLVLRTSCW